MAQKLPGSPFPGARIGQEMRRLLSTQIFKRCGRHVRINYGANFGTGARIQLGENSSLGSNCWIASDTTIGSDVMMARDVVILSGGHQFAKTDIPMREQGAVKSRKVIVGSDVWIGTRAIILPGVHIGSHSLVVQKTHGRLSMRM